MTIINALPFQLQNGTTADATQVMADFDEILNDVNNNAAHNGVNSDITALTALTTPITPAAGGSTIFYGAGSGTANAQIVSTLAPTGFTLTAGYSVYWIPSVGNTGTTTLSANGTAATTIFVKTGFGLYPLIGGEIILGELAKATFDGTEWVLDMDPMVGFGPAIGLASATPDLGTALSHTVTIIGTTTITSFGATAVISRPLYKLIFQGALILTYNATSLILPGSANITTANGDTADALYLGSGNWQIINYFRASGRSLLTAASLTGAVGLVIVNDNGTPSSQIDITADQVTMNNNSLGTAISATGVSVVINTSTTGVNGLDTGSRAVSTWYNLFLISNGSTIAGLASLSATAPTLPSGYVYFMRVGAMLTDSSGNFYRTRQQGASAVYTPVTGSNTTVMRNMATAGAAVTLWTAIAVGGFVPPTATRIKVQGQGSLGSNGTFGVVPNSNYTTSAVSSAPINFANSTSNQIQVGLLADFNLESTNIYYGVTSTVANVAVNCYGWTDKVNAS